MTRASAVDWCARHALSRAGAHGSRSVLAVSRSSIAEANEWFHGLHERAYTFRLDSAIEIVNFHVVASVPTRKPELTSFAGERGDGRRRGAASVDYDEEGHLESAIYERGNLRPGVAITVRP